MTGENSIHMQFHPHEESISRKAHRIFLEEDGGGNVGKIITPKKRKGGKGTQRREGGIFYLQDE